MSRSTAHPAGVMMHAQRNVNNGDVKEMQDRSGEVTGE